MGTFRKKPVVVEAFQLTKESRDDNSSWPAWATQAWNKHDGRDGIPAEEGALSCEIGIPDGPLYVFTKEGKMTAEIGDWIIRGVKGELYPCKPDIFAATYEEVLVDQDAARAAAGFDRPLEKYHSSNPKIGGE